MRPIVEAAYEKLGDPGNERCYCLKIPAILGGLYETDNIGTVQIVELISFAGDLAEQIDDLPDGAQVEFKFMD